MQAPTSTLTMSPSFSTTFLEGMPWMTTSLTEMQADPENPPVAQEGRFRSLALDELAYRGINV